MIGRRNGGHTDRASRANNELTLRKNANGNPSRTPPRATPAPYPIPMAIILVTAKTIPILTVDRDINHMPESIQ